LHEAADADGIREVWEDHPTGEVPGGYGSDHPLAGDDGGGGDGLPEDQRGRWPAADSSGTDTAIYFLQLWFSLSDPAVAEELYDSVAMRNFVGIDLGV
jgi:Transposase domain (DUF772)